MLTKNKNLPSLYLHPAHMEQEVASPVSRDILLREFVPLQAKGPVEGTPVPSLQHLPQIELAEGRLKVAAAAGGSRTVIKLLMREVVLGRCMTTGLPLLAVGAATDMGGVWLVLINANKNTARRFLARLGALGALRLDFHELYQLCLEPLGGPNPNLYPVVKKGRPSENAKLVGKMLKISDNQDEDSVPDIVRQEVTILAAVQGHPNVLRLHGLFFTGEEVSELEPWVVVMERYNGEDLFGAAVRSPFTEAEAKYTVACILAALVHVHNRKILHRDVKPENIVFAPGCRAVLADFSIACHIHDSLEMERRCGSPGYAAPEILTGQCYSQKVDCFSCGSLLYFIIAVKSPFHSSNLASILRRTERCQIDFANSKFGNVSDVCKNFILRLLERHPAQRLSAKMALKDPWISSLDPDFMGSRPSSPLSSSFDGVGSHPTRRRVHSDGDTSDSIHLGTSQIGLPQGGSEGQLPRLRRLHSVRGGNAAARPPQVATPHAPVATETRVNHAPASAPEAPMHPAPASTEAGGRHVVARVPEGAASTQVRLGHTAARGPEEATPPTLASTEARAGHAEVSAREAATPCTLAATEASVRHVAASAPAPTSTEARVGHVAASAPEAATPNAWAATEARVSHAAASAQEAATPHAPVATHARAGHAGASAPDSTMPRTLASTEKRVGFERGDVAAAAAAFAESAVGRACTAARHARARQQDDG
mmetsp:Transcript_104959/g.327322  ORF Transcript_104959/g.327322 Transcript_104959/m.327322 type:complete len:712 (-) Transcript_104959:95-2230(-)